MKINYKIDKVNEKVELSGLDYTHLFRIISWEEVPHFQTPGRTGWYLLNTPVLLDNGVLIKALKLKGIGLWNPEGRNAKEAQLQPIPPTKEAYRRRSLHVGFSNDGTIVRIPSEDAPYGGILLRRARMEYDSAEVLQKNHVPSILPYMVVEYPDLVFHGEMMGVAICGCVEQKPYRLLHLGWEYKYVPEHLQRFYNQIALQNGICDSLETFKGKLKLSVLIGEQYGKAIRGLTESNLYIHSGGWDNIQYDFSRNTVFLTDLDSTRSNKVLSDKVKAISGVRDVVSCLYRYVNKLYYPKAIGVYDVGNLLKYDVIAAIIKGYFYDIDEFRCVQVARKIWRFFLPYFCELKKLGEEIHTLSSPLRKTLKMELDMFYLVSLHYLYPIMLSVQSRTVMSCSMTADEYEEYVKRYLGDRYDFYALYCDE